MARDRITEAKLNEAAEELSNFTGLKFFVNFPNGVPTLYVKNRRGGCNTCFSGDSHRDLHDQIYRFHAGIQYGLNLARDGKNPDLQKPQEALARIERELEALSHAGGYPQGYENNVLQAHECVVAAKDYADAPLEEDEE